MTHLLLAEVPNLVTSTREGDIFIIAVGVAIGVTVANLAKGLQRWFLGGAHERDLEKVIAKAIERAEHDRLQRESAERVG